MSWDRGHSYNPPSSMDAPTDLTERYHITSHLARGGMADVYEGRTPSSIAGLRSRSSMRSIRRTRHS